MHTPRPRLFIGVGNPLRRDDGVGVHVASLLRRLPLPRDIEIYDAGTAGPAAAMVLERRLRVVAVDAIDAGSAPGSVFRLGPEDLRPAVRTGMSLHDAHLLDALDETRLLGTAPRAVTIFAVQTHDVSFGTGLSAAVERALPGLLALAVRELCRPLPRLRPDAHLTGRTT